MADDQVIEEHLTDSRILEAVRNLHRPVNRTLYALHSTLVIEEACPNCLGGIYSDDPDAPRECGCWGLTTPTCSSCADWDGGRSHGIQWPCPTVQALGEE